MNIKKFFKNEYLMGVLCNGINIFVGIAYSALIVRYLGADLKGQTAYISSVMTLIAVFLDFGLHQVYPFYRKDDPNVKEKYINNVYGIFFVYVAVAACLCWIWRGNETLISITVLTLVATYMKIVGYVYMVENSVKKNFLMLIVHVVQLGYVVLLMVFTQESLFWGVTNLIFVDLVLSVVYTIKLKVKPDFRKMSLRFIAKTFALGFVPMITVLASKMSYKIDILMLEAFPNVSMAELGIYSVGVVLAEKVLMIPNALKSVLVSKLSKGKSAEEVAMVMRMCFVVCFMTLVGIAVAGQPLVYFLYGSNFDNAYSVTVITMFGVCAVMFHRMIEIYNIVQHKQKFTLVVVVTSTIVNVVVNLFLIPRWGIVGAAVATTISYTYSAVACLVYFSRSSGIKIYRMIFITRSDIKLVKSLFSKKKSVKKSAELSTDNTAGETANKE